MRSRDWPRRWERESDQPADRRLCGDLTPAAAQRRPQLQTVYHQRLTSADRPRQTADRGQDRGTIKKRFCALTWLVFAGFNLFASPHRVPCALLVPDRVGQALLDPWAPTTQTRTSPDPLVDRHSQYCLNGKLASVKWLIFHFAGFICTFSTLFSLCLSSGGPPGGQYPQGWGNAYQQWQPHDPSESFCTDAFNKLLLWEYLKCNDFFFLSLSLR